MSLITFHGVQSRASTPPTEEWVTFFLTRVKKKVTKKESTLRGTPGFTHVGSGKPHRSQLRARRGSTKGYQSSLCVSKKLLDGSISPCSVLWTGKVRTIADLHRAKPRAQNNVLSFLVTSFFTRVKKEVTRSSGGRVEALLLTQKRTQARSKWMTSSAVESPAFAGMTNHQREPDSNLRWNDEPKTEIKQRSSSCAG